MFSDADLLQVIEYIPQLIDQDKFSTQKLIQDLLHNPAARFFIDKQYVLEYNTTQPPLQIASALESLQLVNADTTSQQMNCILDECNDVEFVANFYRLQHRTVQHFKSYYSDKIKVPSSVTTYNSGPSILPTFHIFEHFPLRFFAFIEDRQLKQTIKPGLSKEVKSQKKTGLATFIQKLRGNGLYIIEYVCVSAVEIKLLDIYIVDDKDHYLRMPFQERFSAMQAIFPDNILNPVTSPLKESSVYLLKSKTHNTRDRTDYKYVVQHINGYLLYYIYNPNLITLIYLYRYLFVGIGTKKSIDDADDNFEIKPTNEEYYYLQHKDTDKRSVIFGTIKRKKIPTELQNTKFEFDDNLSIADFVWAIDKPSTFRALRTPMFVTFTLPQNYKEDENLNTCTITSWKPYDNTCERLLASKPICRKRTATTRLY